MASPAFSLSLVDAAGLSETGNLDYTSIVRILRAIEARLKPLETQSGSLNAAIEAVRKVGLDRINEVLVPAIQLILDIQSKGFMIAGSSTSATMVVGDVLTFVIDDEGQRALFTPSDFVGLTRKGTPDDYAVLRTVAYTVEDGKFIGQVVSFEGDPGPHTDWVLGALAGSTMASVMAMSRVLAARDDAVAAASVAVPAAATATAKAGVATDAAAAAIAAAATAATFDPSAYYSKSQIDTAIGNEATARATAVTDEATARAGADTALANAIAAITFGSLRPHQIKTVNFSAAAFYRYRCETGAGAISTSLPATPVDGTIVTFRRKGANNLTIGRNGKTISNSATDLVIDADKREVELTYNATTGDWEVVARAYA